MARIWMPAGIGGDTIDLKKVTADAKIGRAHV